MTRAFVTGVTGQDGSYLAERLIAKGWEVHGLVRSPEVGDINRSVVQHVGDLRDLSTIDAMVRACEPDVIFNLAGVSSVAHSWQDPVLTTRVTGTAAVQLLQSAWQMQEATGRRVRFVQASSSEIFGGTSDSPQTEDTPIEPVTPYGAAKALAHNMVKIYRRRGLAASAAILYNHESPRRPESFVSRKITRTVARISAGLEERLVLGDLKVRRDWGWAPDYVEALVRIAESPEPDDFVVATGISYSVEEFVASAFKAAGISDWRRYVTTDIQFSRPNDVTEMRGDASKARERLGWKPTTYFDEIVEQMVTSDLDALSL